MTPPTWFGRAPASKGRQAKKAVSASAATTATKAAAPARQRGRTTPAKPAGGKRASPTLGEQVLALADRQDAAGNHGCMQGARPNHVGASLPGTSELAASNCGDGSSTPRSRRRRSN